MARKAGSTISQEELYPPSSERIRDNFEALDDARLLDLDAEKESPFLRGQERISVRRGSIPRKTATRLGWAALALFVVSLCGLAVAALYHYGEQSWRFRVESGDDIEVTGLENVTRAQVMEAMGGDIGRNIFFVPLSERKKSLERIPWVESASVMRFVPNRLKIEIHERIPVAFARVGSKVFLVDASGVLMDLPMAHKKKYSFPVVLGMNLGEPHSTSAARMKHYNQLMSQLEAGGAHYSQDLSEVDISDTDDVKVLVGDPRGEVLVHLGSSGYLERYKIYVAHVQEWRQQFSRLESVDLRYDSQIVVNPDLQGAIKQPPLSSSTVKAAVSAGVKPAALISHDQTLPKGSGIAQPKLAPKNSPKAVVRRNPARRKHAKPIVKPVKSEKTTPVPAPVAASPASQMGTAPTSSSAPSNSVTDTSQGGKKPSPAIAKGQEHP
jgi:cell division protein FtsQ